MGLASKLSAAAGAPPPGGAVGTQPSAPPYMAYPPSPSAGQQKRGAYPPVGVSGPAHGQQPDYPPGTPPQAATQYGQQAAPGGYVPQQGGYPGAQPQQGGYPGAQPQQGGYPGAQPQLGGFPGAQPQQGGYPGAQPQRPQSQAPPATAPPGGGGGNNAGVMQALQNKLQQIITTNQLQSFYPPQALQQVMTRLGGVDFRALAARWNMPLELATDLATLSLYDVIIYADDSGSMIFEEGGDRINDLKLILGRIAEVATLFDDDGILIRFMNSTVEGNGIRDAGAAAALVQQVQFNGLTPLGTNLDKKVIQPFLAAGVHNRNLQKPILVIAITDGEPAGEPVSTTSNVIRNAKNLVSSSQYGPGAIAFQFAQVGKDQKAQTFLGVLDNDPVIGGMVDATSYYELEAEEYARKGVNLTPELWLVKLMVGAIDPSYDEQD